GCQPPSASALALSAQASVCYHLQFTRWTSIYSGPFGNAAVAWVSPLPDTIALTSTVVTSYGRAYYEALRVPADSMQATGTWRVIGPDTLVIGCPPEMAVLMMRVS